MPLVLASSSPYRKTLLARLGLPFTCASPDVDETPLPHEQGLALSARLALSKARALAPRFPDALIIGCDQVCVRGATLAGKPGSREAARAQLIASSGRWVEFHTALVLLDAQSNTHQSAHDLYRVKFRPLDPEEIDRYLDREQPYDCAGGFKAEGLGINLFERMEGGDFHSLIGLPLISLCRLLRERGLNPLSATVPAAS
ncbi:MAG: Maf family nucleotide pyrophosphatase [Pseudomonadales bacterium]|jgi:MAF protein|nr:Maf family nucleotide pyrophosphatase [Pseudomonadales bacterium]